MERKAGFFRNFVFGVEDSLVSTVGLLSGVAAAGTSAWTTFTTGVILIFVEAFSMAIGSYLSENSAQEFVEHRQEPLGQSVPNSLIMFFSYFISGFVPLFPYLFFDASRALPISVGASLIALLALGFGSARLSKTSVWKGVLRMMLLGGTAIALGISVGLILK